MKNWKVIDKNGKTCVVLAHTKDHAIERAYKMYLIRGIKTIELEY